MGIGLTATAASSSPIGLETIAASTGLVAVQPKGGKLFGYVDVNGECCIPSQFDEAEAFYNGLALVEQDGHIGLIDKTGQWVWKQEMRRSKLEG